MDKRFCTGCGAAIETPAADVRDEVIESVEKTLEKVLARISARSGLCLVCATKKGQEPIESVVSTRDGELERRARRLERLWPPYYRDTDPTHPAMDQNILRRVMSWKLTKEGKGLGFYSEESGTCKTRMMFLKTKELVMAGIDVEVVRASDFGSLAERSQFSVNREEREIAACKLKRLTLARVLLIDDLGKEFVTDAVEDQLFNLVDKRLDHLRPILFTSNWGSEGLASGWKFGRGPQIVRRLIEMCETIRVPARRRDRKILPLAR